MWRLQPKNNLHDKEDMVSLYPVVSTLEHVCVTLSSADLGKKGSKINLYLHIDQAEEFAEYLLESVKQAKDKQLVRDNK